jgi:hypothetical protein
MLLRLWKLFFCSFAICWLLLSFSLPAHAGIDFQPVNPQELQMASEPLAPGAPAIILYRQVDRDDNSRMKHEDNYMRIKILTDAGRSYADVEIPFNKEQKDVSSIRARSIAPNGTITNFDGKPFEKTIVKARGVKYLAKVFTLPNVQKGSIIEYSYTYDFPDNWIYDSRWILSEELFTKEAHFSLKGYNPDYAVVYMHWSWRGLPPGTDAPAQGQDKVIRLVARDIPAFQTEDYMPPANELKSRVDFVYSYEKPELDQNKFWSEVGKRRYERLNSFLGKRGALQGAVNQIVSPSDDPEMKLKKLYARVQQLRNTSYELRRTAQEEKRDKTKENKNIEDVWKHGYGDGVELTWLYVGLARDAGFESYGVYVADRMNYFFDQSQMDSFRLDSNVALVKAGGKDIYCDPGAKFASFGLLPWYETGVQGLRLDKDGGAWIKTPLPESSLSQVMRKAELKAGEDGTVEGKLTVTYTGLEAMEKREDERHEDDQERKKYLEELVKSYISAEADVDLQNHPDWSSSAPELTAEFKIKIPGWISSAGKRLLLPTGFFTATEKGLFEHASRVHPVYFEFPFQKHDEVRIALPDGMSVGNLPAAQKLGGAGAAVSYDLKVENSNKEVLITRSLRLDVLAIPPGQYAALHAFFQHVRLGDDSQIMLQAQVASADK